MSGCPSGSTFQSAGSSCGNPCPTQACCSALTGLCTTTGISGTCGSGSTSQGPNSSCTPNPCPQPPPPSNDECENALPLEVGVEVQGNNTFATVSVVLTNDATIPWCAQATWGNVDQHDMFYIFHAPATADYTVDTCGNITNFDTIVDIHTACPVGQDNMVSCNDDSSQGTDPVFGANIACTENGLHTRIPHVTLMANTDYWFRVWGYNAQTGVFQLHINYNNPTGTCCASGNTCTLTDQVDCTDTWTQGNTCTANPCGGGGICCRGGTCTTQFASAGACTGSLPSGSLAGAVFASGGACNAANNTHSPCCYADYNKQNGIQIQDIFDFLNDWFAGRLAAHIGSDGSTGPLVIDDVFNFLNAWFAGGC
jgi:hypothetical protein